MYLWIFKFGDDPWTAATFDHKGALFSSKELLSVVLLLSSSHLLEDVDDHIQFFISYFLFLLTVVQSPWAPFLLLSAASRASSPFATSHLFPAACWHLFSSDGFNLTAVLPRSLKTSLAWEDELFFLFHLAFGAVNLFILSRKTVLMEDLSLFLSVLFVLCVQMIDVI